MSIEEITLPKYKLCPDHYDKYITKDGHRMFEEDVVKDLNCYVARVEKLKRIVDAMKGCPSCLHRSKKSAECIANCEWQPNEKIRKIMEEA